MFYSSLTDFKIETSKTDIDIFICSSSFEDRCFNSARCASEFDINNSLVCYNENEELSIVKNAKLIADILGDSSSLIKLNSDDPIKNFNLLSNTIIELLNDNDMANIWLDTTTFTHETLLVILKIFELEKSKIGKIFISYVGATDYSYNSINNDEKWLSKGIKEIRTVLGFSGSYDPIKKNHLIILFGFESERTKMLIDSFEFNSVTLGCATKSQSIQSNHQSINFERHKAMLSDYPDAKLFEFSLIDPEETKRQILDHVQTFKNYNIVVAPMNNKLSTIGVGLAALENTDIQITYAKPNLYNHEAYSKSSEEIYFFTLNL